MNIPSLLINAEKAGLRTIILGCVKEFPLILLTPTHKVERNILIAAGFHGEEPAGVLAINEFIGTNSNVSASFLPLVNPTGFYSNHRYNDYGQNPNNGWCHTESGIQELSYEGEMIQSNIGLIKSLAIDGFISLHEDCDETKFYLYTFEHSNEPGDFSNTLRNAELKHFDHLPDSILAGAQVKNGIIFNEHDGSFEDYLFHEGIQKTACTETPGQLPIEKRVKANIDIIKTFINF